MRDAAYNYTLMQVIVIVLLDSDWSEWLLWTIWLLFCGYLKFFVVLARERFLLVHTLMDIAASSCAACVCMCMCVHVHVCVLIIGYVWRTLAGCACRVALFHDVTPACDHRRGCPCWRFCCR